MPTPFVADAADEAVRSNSILNERKATDIIEETALEVDIRAWRAEGLRLLQAASAREDKVPNGARRPCSVLGDASAQAAIEDAVTRMSRTEGVPQRPPRALGSTLAPPPEPPFIPKFRQRTLFFSTVALFFITLFGGFIFKELELERELRDARHARVAPFDTFRRILRTFDFHTGGISLLSLVIQYLQERALPRSVTGAKDPTAPTQSEGGIDRYQLSNAPEVAVTLERHSLSPYRLTLTDGL